MEILDEIPNVTRGTFRFAGAVNSRRHDDSWWSSTVDALLSGAFELIGNTLGYALSALLSVLDGL